MTPLDDARVMGAPRPGTARGLTAVIAGALIAALLAAGAAGQPAASPDVVATGVRRPLQIALDRGDVVVLAAGAGAAAAGELRRFPLDALPADLTAVPAVRIAFAETRMAALGSLAIDPGSGALFLGEENGRRIWRLGDGGRLTLYATGLQRLAGGGTLTVDRAGRLVVVDHADPRLTVPDEPTPPGLEQFREDDHRGPLVYRLALDPDIPLPRPLDRLTPFFPRPSPHAAGWLARLVAVAPMPGDRLALVTSAGEVLCVGEDRRLTPHARLPAGQYVRVNAAATPDGWLYVSGGFWVASVFEISPTGRIRTLAAGLADPQGIAVDAAGRVYVAESSLHRIVRVPGAAGR